MRTVEDLLGAFEPQIESCTLVPSRGGVFEVTVDGDLVYSKRATGRHAEDGEVAAAVAGRVG